jgi:hypothetical protein
MSALVGGVAHAGVCVEVDASRDTLAEGDRNATRFFLAQALQREGVPVVQQDCAQTFVVYHVRLGNSITVFMQAPQGYRQATARTLEDVPALYSQMVRSMLSGRPMTTTNDTVDRTNATAAQQAPNRVEADSLWYARLGYGGVNGPSFSSGPAFGFGYRYELDSLGIDLSFLNLVVSNDNTSGSSSGGTAALIKLMGLYFLNPTANRSSYLGAGVGWGTTSFTRVGDVSTNSPYSSYSGSGLQGQLSAGYEFLRASTIRMFVQADATLPFYMIRSNVFVSTDTRQDSSYSPSFAVSLGLGWGHSITRVHVVH